MDMMTLRRMVMTQMTSGAQYIKGTFTIPSNGSGAYTIDFGKTFASYLFLIEMTDDSKTMLMNTGITSARTFAFIGTYPIPRINNSNDNYVAMCKRVSPSTGECGATYISTMTCSSTSISNPCGSTNNANYFYRDYSYNYYIVEIK